MKTKDRLHLADVEFLKSFDVTLVQDPGFTAMQKDRYTCGLLDGSFGGWCQVWIEEDALGETIRSGGSQLDVVLSGGRYAAFSGEDTFQVRELWNSVNSVTSSGESWTSCTALTAFLH